MRWAWRSWLLVLAVTISAAACSSAEAADTASTSDRLEPLADLPQAPAPTTTTMRTTTTETAAPASTTSSTTAPIDPVAVVVRAGGLDDGFIDTIESLDGVDRVAVLRSGQVRMVASEDRSGRPVDRLDPGFVIQLDARVYEDPAALAAFAPEVAASLADLEPDELVLSRSSADLRRLGVGGTIEFVSGARFRVGAVLADEVVGTAEVVLAGSDGLEVAGADADGGRRAALVRYRGLGQDLEERLTEANGGAGIRVFGGRGGDDEQDRQSSTLSQIEVKQTFGEFAFRPGEPTVEIDPAWIEANLVVADFPLLGQARCHRVFAEALTEVLQGLIDDGLADLIDPGAFQGCWNPRTIAGSDRLSKHAWGIAADINFGNPLDEQPGSPVHPELLERMDQAGFVSGHRWTTPDPGHFEYRRPGLDATETGS